MSLLEPPQDTRRKSRPMAFTVAALLLVTVVGLWWIFRFYPEKRAAEHFFDAVVAGDMAQAYKLWKPTSSYKMDDFLADWGATGYYGPVKSYKIIREDSPTGSNAVQISVAISPFSPMPSPADPAQAEQSHKTRVVAVWVVSRDKAFTFPP
jgi:ABC-type nickel/cobalt efflux system permease component RcnA